MKYINETLVVEPPETTNGYENPDFERGTIKESILAGTGAAAIGHGLRGSCLVDHTAEGPSKLKS